MSNEQSGSGAPIFRHETSAEGELSAGDPGLVDAVTEHVERHFGEVAGVIHEIVSPYVHVDLHVVAPTEARPMTTVVTSGMSERPMADGSYAELMLVLPPDWPLDGPGFEAEEGYWPFRLLKTLARLPHEHETVLGLGHTVPNGDPPRPYSPTTKLCGALIGPMVLHEHRDAGTFSHAGRDIDLHAVWPLHADEMRVKLDQGLDRLYDLLDDASIVEVVEPDRPSVVPKRRLRDRFRR